MLSRLGEAVKDAAETLRRAFQDPASRPVPLGFQAPAQMAAAGLAPVAQPGLVPLAAAPGGQRLQPEPLARAEAVGLAAQMRSEQAWSAWSSGARVVAMPVFRAGATGRLQVPALPRRAACRGGDLAGPFAGRARSLRDPLPRPRDRSVPVGLAAGTVRRGLDLIFALPVAIAGEDLGRAPRAVQMRCSLQMVKASGENVRNLELLGRYAIPDRGVRELRHDPGSGRVLVRLDPEAAGAGRRVLLIARRRDDRSLVTCFPEEP